MITKLNQSSRKRQLTLKEWLAPKNKNNKTENGLEIPIEQEESISSTIANNETMVISRRRSDYYEGYTKKTSASCHSLRPRHSAYTTIQDENNNNGNNKSTNLEYGMPSRDRDGIYTVISNMHVLVEKSSHKCRGTGASVSASVPTAAAAAAATTTTAVKKEEVEEEVDFISNAEIDDNPYSQNTEPFPQNYFGRDYTHGINNKTNNTQDSNHALKNNYLFGVEHLNVRGAMKKKVDDIIATSTRDDNKENLRVSSKRNPDRCFYTAKRMR